MYLKNKWFVKQLSTQHFSGGHFTAEKRGHFAVELGGHLCAELGGHYQRILHTAKDVAEKIITKNVSATKVLQQQVLETHKDQFKLVQFHPAYSYEDFVRSTKNKTDQNLLSQYYNQVHEYF